MTIDDILPPEFVGCPTDIVLIAPLGETQMIVGWSVPQVSLTHSHTHAFTHMHKHKPHKCALV